MPPVAIAGIGAVGSILGGAIASSGAKSAAKSQASAAEQQIAANNANRQQIVGLSQPTIDRGNSAGSIYAGLLGLGDAAASKSALGTWRGSVGYQDTLNTGLGSVNANAYARGRGDSGATLKALQAKGMALADQNQGVYMSNLNNLIQTGNSAIGNVAGVSTQTTQANNAALQNSADASSNATLATAAGWNKTLSNLANIGSNFASSYGGAKDIGMSPTMTGQGYWGGPNNTWPGQTGGIY